ncbi:glycosyltransferase [Marivirga sp.]|uniref:glycosyltransferase n=1 Tax=Marivirga sp. TaxID=2018662 RepID=UPI002D7FAE6C|nr:glycosyltransferase [Marivirga sp.]HET8859507.1 glycosyltransferase [Marivirga sp.]
MKKASIIISFYNRVDQLKLILAALERQTVSEFEVIISDDGSKEEAVNQINEIIEKSTLTIQHIWHPDTGFNKTKILNKSILASNSPYIIFIDGDCIPEIHFIEDHLKYATENRVVVGRRVELSNSLSKEITREYIYSKSFDNLWFKALINSFKRETRKAEEGIRLSSKWLNEKFGTTKKGILGCNFSLHKKVLIKLNGFDERYIYPGVGEDTEIKERLKNGGYEIFKPKYALVQYHLWHKKQSREGEKEGFKLLDETIKNNYIQTPYGINKL